MFIRASSARRRADSPVLSYIARKPLRTVLPADIC
jgi:hypothetical protein